MFFLELEDQIISNISILENHEYFALPINDSIENIKNEIASWKNNVPSEVGNIIRGIKDMDYFIAIEIVFFHIKNEADFYDADKFHYHFNCKFKVLMIDCNNQSILDEQMVSVLFVGDQNKEQVQTQGKNLIVKKTIDLLKELSIFKLKTYNVKDGILFVWLDKGKSDGIKNQNYFVLYKNENYTLKEKAAVQIVSVQDDKSLAAVLYKSKDLSSDDYYTRNTKINLELQIAGGFSFANKDNPVNTRNNYFSIISSAFIRTCIPVGITYFRPIVQLEFNFFYLDNKLLLPFTLETGVQGQFFFHRFFVNSGLLAGALFSPDLNNNYQIDSFILRPYLQFSALLNLTVKLFGELGYRFFIEGQFFKNWQIDLKGPYFMFGIGLNL
jgi:hypothetical protein